MSRDLAKPLTFAVLHFAVGFTVSYAFTGSIAIASGIALVEPLVNTVVFYFHERGWQRVEGGDLWSALRRAFASSHDHDFQTPARSGT